MSSFQKAGSQTQMVQNQSQNRMNRRNLESNNSLERVLNRVVNTSQKDAKKSFNEVQEES